MPPLPLENNLFFLQARPLTAWCCADTAVALGSAPQGCWPQALGNTHGRSLYPVHDQEVSRTGHLVPNPGDQPGLPNSWRFITRYPPTVTHVVHS
jgi:hypothetical protein